MPSIYMKGPSWYARVKDGTGRWRGIALSANSKTSARQLAAELARKFERQRLGLEALPSDDDMTLGELCEWWLSTRCPEASRERERFRLGKHVLRTRLGSLPLAAVTTARLDEHLYAMSARGAAPASVNHLRAVLRIVFNCGRKAGLWSGSANPAADLEVRRVPRRIYETLSMEEVGLLLANLPMHWRCFFAVAIFTGMRKGELLRLRKRDLNLAEPTRATICIPVSKGGHADLIPVAPVLLPYLESAVAVSPSELVFPGPDGTPWSHRVAVESILRRALAVAGFVEGYNHTCRRCKSRGNPSSKGRPTRLRARVQSAECASGPRRSCAGSGSMI
jgi:integrase